MIVWVNGSFGAGKTTLVAELHSRWPDALVYDPEQVGLLLGDIVDDPTGDFKICACGAASWCRWRWGCWRSTNARSWRR